MGGWFCAFCFAFALTIAEVQLSHPAGVLIAASGAAISLFNMGLAVGRR